MKRTSSEFAPLANRTGRKQKRRLSPIDITKVGRAQSVPCSGSVWNLHAASPPARHAIFQSNPVTSVERTLFLAGYFVLHSRKK